jgi:plastocyanin
MTGRFRGTARRASRRMIGAALLLVAVFAGVSWAQTPAANSAVVNIDNFAFTPAVLVVHLGTTVTWTNRDDIPHTVTEKKLTFRSKAIDSGEQFSRTFDLPGEIEYFCSLHPHMTGKIVVEP